MTGISIPAAAGRAALLFSVAILLRAGTAAQPSRSTDSRVLFLQRLVISAIERTHHAVRYDPAYVRIPYPGGDVPGDLVTYDLGGGVPHIGIVVDRKGRSGAFMIVHNIGEGPKMEDVLFNWKNHRTLPILRPAQLSKSLTAFSYKSRSFPPDPAKTPLPFHSGRA